jgi:hypothetical protein
MNGNTATEGIEAKFCSACQLIPLSYLTLDLDEPVVGWERTLAERGVEVELDDLGRPSVPREALGGLIAEQRERAARRVEPRPVDRQLVPAGIPARDDASPLEVLQMADGYVTVAQEFGSGRVSPQREFLDEQLAEGQRLAAQQRAEAELLERAQRVLDGRET